MLLSSACSTSARHGTLAVLAIACMRRLALLGVFDLGVQVVIPGLEADAVTFKVEML